MPTSYSDQFFSIDPGNPPWSGERMTFQRATFTDQDDNDLIRNHTGDTFNGVRVTDVWVGDTVKIQLDTGEYVTYRGVTFYLETGQPVFTPTDGQVLQNGTFVRSTFVTNSTQTGVGNFGPVCFTPGTLIDMAAGRMPVERIAVGDLVQTLDHGVQPVRMILRDTFRAVGDLAPVRFATGALGNDAPLMVSPQHRMLITGWRAEMFFGQDEVLVAAKHLVNGDTIRQVPGGTVDYIHLLFDAHQIVFGQGVPSESYFPLHAMETSGDASRAEVLALFPQLEQAGPEVTLPVRAVIRRCEATVLVA